MAAPDKTWKIPWHLMLIFLCLSAGILVLGYLFYANQAAHFRREMEAQLNAIANLKVKQIVDGRQAPCLPPESQAGRGPSGSRPFGERRSKVPAGQIQGAAFCQDPTCGEKIALQLAVESGLIKGRENIL